MVVMLVLDSGFCRHCPPRQTAECRIGEFGSEPDGAESSVSEIAQAGLSMEKYNAQLRDSETITTAWFRTCRRVAAMLRCASNGSSPQHEILAVANGKYTLFRPRLNMAYVGNSKSKGNKAGGVLEMMYMSRQQLEARFQPVQDVREETLWGGVSTIHLTLVPKGNASFKYAEIWVDSSGMPVQTKIVEKNDDATTMRLSGLEKNAEDLVRRFQIKA